MGSKALSATSVCLRRRRGTALDYADPRVVQDGEIGCVRVCLISGEFFAWGKYGGFGRATRVIGRGLLRHGVEVMAVVPRRQGQRAEEDMDGIKVFGFPRYAPWIANRFFRDGKADIYHSQEPSLAGWLASQTAPKARHVITFRDPRGLADWLTELRLPSRSRLETFLSCVYEAGPWNGWAVHQADVLCCAACVVGQRAQRLYGLRQMPMLLPTPVEIPPRVEKSATPLVCYVGRLDRRKQPQKILALAPQFPSVRFVLVGQAQNRAWGNRLREMARSLPNVEMWGFVDQFRDDRLFRLLNQSWVFVNTAAREGLPNAFLEAAAHGCAILSAVDPDGFASSFGAHVADGGFAGGLRRLLTDDLWRTQGQRGREYVRTYYEAETAIQQHLRLYEMLLGEDSR